MVILTFLESYTHPLGSVVLPPPEDIHSPGQDLWLVRSSLSGSHASLYQ